MNLENNQYSDSELDAMCLAAEKEQIYKNYRAAIDEYNKLQNAYNKLEHEHQILQNLFVQEEFEHDETKMKYQQSQDNYHTVIGMLRNFSDKIDDLQAEVLELRHKVSFETK